MSNEAFKQRVYELVAQIPRGKVMSYGQIAAMCDYPQAARIVGGVAHFGDSKLPWQRVVHSDGRLAVGYPGGVQGQREHLEAEGVAVNDDFKVDMGRYQWRP